MTTDATSATGSACPICSMSHAAGRWCSAPYERSPLAGEINELPERLRSWIHHLETDADPAGTLRENFVLREAVAALGAKADKAEARAAELEAGLRRAWDTFNSLSSFRTQRDGSSIVGKGMLDICQTLDGIDKENT